MIEGASWKKASQCGSSACVEVRADGGTILVRDANDRHGPRLAFDLQAWAEFCDGLRKGRFDR